jgi:SecD/SecF fusion protein
LLTILGFSLYDTIIVFDRIRENVPRMPRATFAQIVNRSMSEVITRSLVTSMSTLMPILALMLFGGETLRDFGFALLIGVASGTYSSIFIAAPVLTHWKERESVWRRRERIVMEDHDGVVPAYAETVLGDEAPKTLRRERAVSKRGRAGTRAKGEPAAGTTAVEEKVVEEPVVADPVVDDPVVESPAVEAESPVTPGRTGNGGGGPVSSRAAARRAARQREQAARAEAEAGDRGPDGDAKAEAERAAAKRAAANRRRKKHGRSR